MRPCVQGVLPQHPPAVTAEPSTNRCITSLSTHKGGASDAVPALCEYLAQVLASADLSSPRGYTPYPYARLEPWPRSGPPPVSSAHMHANIGRRAVRRANTPPGMEWNGMEGMEFLCPPPPSTRPSRAIRGARLPSVRRSSACTSWIGPRTGPPGFVPLCLSPRGVPPASFLPLALSPSTPAQVRPVAPVCFPNPLQASTVGCPHAAHPEEHSCASAGGHPHTVLCPGHRLTATPLG